MKISVGRLFMAYKFAHPDRFPIDMSNYKRKLAVQTSISKILEGCNTEIEIPDEELERLDPFLERPGILKEDLVFTTCADFYGIGTMIKIEIAKKDGQIFVNKRQASIEYNGLQLRFKTAYGIYIVFDDDSTHHHSPPLPIKEMWERLK